MKNLFFLLLFILSASYASAQFTDRYWCFGDSAGIDFRNLNNPIPGESVLRSRGTCASICDSSGTYYFTVVIRMLIFGFNLGHTF
ncbi:MAG: hypothetical protein IPF81_07205 [Bacteroidetes bacterium]|nr:hypothetical protein [Bacteroidota bacterium]